MSKPVVLTIAIPTPLRRTFDYRLPDHLLDREIAAGMRVQVSFGHQTLVGIILSAQSHSAISLEQLKPIDVLLDSEPCVTAEILSLTQWAAAYYQYPIGEALTTALPVLLRQGQTIGEETEVAWQLTTEGKGLPEGALSRAPKQADVLAQLQHTARLSDKALKDSGAKQSVLKELQKKGLIETCECAPDTQAPAPTKLLAQHELLLNDEQVVALGQIDINHYNAYLLEGATGSGKTEIYLQAITRVIESGKTALVLVPEIGLTPQLISRFQARFNVPVVNLHSGLSDKERARAWFAAKQDNAQIVIGTRSAIFTPMPSLGLIVIDEEHDLSFKQQEGFRYSARDLAVVRAQRLGIPLILGSATPALETLYNAIQNRYQHLRLTRRAGVAKPPHVELIDLRGQRLEEGFSTDLLRHIESTLEKHEQVLVFINRRGFAPVIMCHDCGWAAVCPNCSAKMTVHRFPPHLHCHHCDHQRPIAKTCPECRSHDLEQLGLGTERSEAVLQECFPDTPIIRVDRDTTRRKNAMSDLLAEVIPGEPCILIGTQMLAKGHHFPDVTLVAILDVDSGLFSADFRGPERMGQLLIQVAGRAGREAKQGQVIIQSHHCDHPNIQSLVKEGYHRYARRLLSERQLIGLPPYRFLALVRAESKRPENALELLKLARQLAQQHARPSPQIQYIGPMPAMMERKQDRFCFQLQINSSDRQFLQRLMQTVCEQLEQNAISRRTRWSVDIDPQDMS